MLIWRNEQTGISGLNKPIVKAQELRKKLTVLTQGITQLKICSYMFCVVKDKLSLINTLCSKAQ